MKKIALLITILSLPGQLFANQSTFQPLPGEIDTSLGWVFLDGKQYSLWWNVTSQGDLINYGFHEVTSRQNPGSSGFNSMVEWGLFPGFSMGMETNLLTFLINAGRGDSLADLDLAVFSVWEVFQSGFFGTQLKVTLEAAPLWKFGEKLDRTSGYFNTFLNLRNYFNLHQTEDNGVRVYLDTKGVTSFTNPLLRQVDGFAAVFNLPPEATKGAEATLGPIIKLSGALGLDFKFGSWIGYVGYNVSYISFTQHYVINQDFWDSVLGFTHVEFGWKWRF